LQGEKKKEENETEPKVGVVKWKRQIRLLLASDRGKGPQRQKGPGTPISEKECPKGKEEKNLHKTRKIFSGKGEKQRADVRDVKGGGKKELWCPIPLESCPGGRGKGTGLRPWRSKQKKGGNRNWQVRGPPKNRKTLVRMKKRVSSRRNSECDVRIY